METALIISNSCGWFVVIYLFLLIQGLKLRLIRLERLKIWDCSLHTNSTTLKEFAGEQDCRESDEQHFH